MTWPARPTGRRHWGTSEDNPPALVILDLMMPGLSGMGAQDFVGKSGAGFDAMEAVVARLAGPPQ
jgi:CheY-like chemotaxis protein